MSTATGRPAEPNRGYTLTKPREYTLTKPQLTHYVGPPPLEIEKQEDVIEIFLDGSQIL